MVVISNGFNKFHLSVLASEMAAAGRLTEFWTAGYPFARLERALQLIPGLLSRPGAKRFVQRREAIPEPLVRAFWMQEIIYTKSQILRTKTPFKRFAESLNAYAFASYGRRAKRKLRRAKAAGASIYHYRAGMGGASVAEAKRLGMVALCDHSIAHPMVLQEMVKCGGALPALPLPPLQNKVERLILADIEAADHILVNSEFVKQTMVHAGCDPDRITVVYLGVDEQFLAGIPESNRQGATPELLFAGGYGVRKGAPQLSSALREINDVPWHLTLAAGMQPDSDKSDPLLKDARVDWLGFVSRAELAKVMSRSDIFIFPTLAEGSARVIFEALACGCYVITTPNGGSIVEDGVHGALVPPGDVPALESAIRRAMDDLDGTREIGRANALLVAQKYTQNAYGLAVAQLYDQLVAEASKRASETPAG